MPGQLAWQRVSREIGEQNDQLWEALLEEAAAFVVGVEEVAYEGVFLGVQDRRGKAVYLIQTVEAEFAVPVARTHCLNYRR